MVGAKVERPGTIAVPAKTISDFISSSPTGTVTLTVQNNKLSLKSQSYETTVLGFDTAEYPIIPKIGGGEVGSIVSDVLKRVFSSVIDAAAVSENRPELSGIYSSFGKEILTVAATDSFRLAERWAPIKGSREETVIIPRMTVMEVIRMCDHVKGDISIRVGDNQIAFSGDDIEIVSRLVDGRYPDYRKIIPDKSVSRALVSRQELEHAVRLASVFSSNISDIILACREDGIRISAKNSAKGNANVATGVTLKGESFEVSLNHHYLSDGLKAVPGDDIVLEFTGTGSPFMIRMAEEPKDTLYLVMPLRN
jgi:DNA polymerase-3 subunit beta